MCIIENAFGGLPNNYFPVQIICTKGRLLGISQMKIMTCRGLPRPCCILGEAQDLVALT